MPSEPDRRTTAFAGASVPENYEARLAPVLFEPWAEILLDAVGVRTGDRVLDVASGTGVAARAAARRAGPGGHVLASDVSGAMVAHAATVPAPPDAAPIDYLEASVTELPLSDGSFDVVLCQQGLPFFTDRPAAAAELRRVVRAGGAVGLSVWAAGRRLEPFDEYLEALIEAGVESPFAGAFDTETFKMDPGEVLALLRGAGFTSVEAPVVEYLVTWPDARSAAEGILGTPFAPLLGGLPADRREALESELVRRFAPASDGEPVRRTTAAVLARAIAPGG